MGNASTDPSSPSTCTVHPHVHGERYNNDRIVWGFFGSSPRTWGTRRHKRNGHIAERFIPTYMGNASYSTVTPSSLTVHPHVHGERAPTCRPSRAGRGSSPRTWGTRGWTDVRPTRDRFIPTYMGNAQRRLLRPPSASVHPHVHGERDLHPDLLLRLTGSSPRTWGTHRIASADSDADRFIPTYMGNAKEWWTSSRETSVHPHVHGERLLNQDVSNLKYGSSPRTWGTPLKVKSSF